MQNNPKYLSVSGDLLDSEYEDGTLTYLPCETRLQEELSLLRAGKCLILNVGISYIRV